MDLDNKAKTLKLKSAVRGTLQPNHASEVTADRRPPFRLHASAARGRVGARRCAHGARGSRRRRAAEKADRDKPINFSGDTGDVNLQAHGGTLTGNVIITQGTLEIHADRIVFKQNADNSLSATAFGNPVAFRQKRDDVDEYYEGYAQRVEYDGSKELVELFDNALLKRGQDEIRSNYISYNAATELFKAEGRAGTVPDPAGPGTRVRGMFQPKSERRLPGKGKDSAEGCRQGRKPRRSRRRPGAGAARDAEAGRRARAARGQVSADPAAGGAAPGEPTLGRAAREALQGAHRRPRRLARRRRAARSSACSARTAPARRPAST